MKTKTRKFYLVLFCFTSILFSACQKEELPVSGTVSGTLTVYNPSTPLVKNPASGVKLYLINTDYPVSTTKPETNRAAIVDSTRSDSKGKYQFSNVRTGNFGVSPVPEKIMYKFNLESGSASSSFSINAKSPDHLVNFTSQIPGGENGLTFQIDIKPPYGMDKKYIRIRRQYFLFFVPFFGDPITLREFTTDNVRFFYFREEYGFTAVLATMTNNFLIECFPTDEPIAYFWITNDLSTTPSESTWSIDLKSKSITRTK